MTKTLPLILILSVSLQAVAQSESGIFAITGSVGGDIRWTKIRKLEDGRSLECLDATKPTRFISAKSHQTATPVIIGGSRDDAAPGATGMAALAYDAENQRLYFTPLFREGGIRYINLNDQGNQRPVTVLDDAYNLIDRARDGEGRNITRMVIGKGHTGYALSNDGNSFIRFSTRGNVEIQNLGPLVDDAANQHNSVHNSCTSWGGDMVAAENGDLYLFTVRQFVYRINPETRVATLLGSLKGMEPHATVNGAAVDEAGRVILASSVQPGMKWVIEDIQSLEARVEKDEQWMNASDLASAHLLFANRSKAKPQVSVTAPPSNGKVELYPNPVTNGNLRLVFHDLKPGKYQVAMINGVGIRQHLSVLEVHEKGQTANISTRQLAAGFYVVRITDAGQREAFSQKVLVQ